MTFDDIGDTRAAAEWNLASTKRALDELFRLTLQYQSSGAYWELLRFIARFRSYSPFNAMLIHVQMPGAKYVATPNRWLRKYGHGIKRAARPLVILQPRGPVMFVFDVSDVEPRLGAPPLPREIVDPFEVRGGKVGNQLELTLENARRDGVRVSERDFGANRAGQIGSAAPGSTHEFPIRSSPEQDCVKVPVRYELQLNGDHSREIRYATLAHELAHLYCGHLGTPDERWWPDRRHLPAQIREFEAESVCYLACQRLGIDNPSEEYLAGYVRDATETPQISLECVMNATGLLERMGHERLKVRNESRR